MKQSPSILKSYFQTRDKPTQSQFEDLIDSMRHLDAKVPVTDIDGLANVLSNYVTQSEYQAIQARRLTAVFSVAQPTFTLPVDALFTHIVIVSSVSQVVNFSVDEDGLSLIELAELSANVPYVAMIQVYTNTVKTLRLTGHTANLSAILYLN